ncbi:phosphotransferase [Paenibacillus sp. KN14-4R]|uniref:phosphotransferase n=1 Tax=Paenibacillus sp. KN14-4R TaxID=3445773 RepID=UPI003FA173BF
MAQRLDVNKIIKDLRETGVIDSTSKVTNKMKGTTDGLVYTLTVNDEPKYVLKLDSAQNISLVEQLLHTYRHATLPPKLLYTDPAKAYIVYTYITGTTHYKRGSKINWLTLLINGLINHYENFQHTDKWGLWLEDPCETWRDFIDQGVEYARINVGSLLPIEDYHKVKSCVGNISKGEGHERFLLHGDCGVHNFVFDQNALKGVIDPSPIVGPVLYDFIYAFCSSPDDLNLETLIPAFTLLNHEPPMERSMLIEEVIIQLYCRIGICLKHHPHDLADYLKAWDYWKVLVP